MKAAVTGLLLLMGLPLAAAPAKKPVAPEIFIEWSHYGAAPLSPQEVADLAQGKVPELRPCQNLFHDFRPGYSSRPLEGTLGLNPSDYANATASLGYVFRRGLTTATLAGSVVAGSSKGLWILRGPDGNIRQAACALDAYFVSMKSQLLVIERYHMYDCFTKADASLGLRPGAVVQTRMEVSERPGQADGVRSFQILTLPRAAAPELQIITFRDADGAREMETTGYASRTEEPAAWRNGSSVRRVFWPEGPGYQQTSRMEAVDEAGKRRTLLHTFDHWKAAQDGTTHKVKSQNLLPSGEGK